MGGVNMALDQIFQLAEKYGKKYNVSPYLIFGIIMTESSGNPNAESKVAKGLMQMTKPQIEHVNRIYKQYFKFEDMSDPELAVDCGTQYLQNLLNYWKKFYTSEYICIYLTLLSYSWGIGNVTKWLRDTPADNQFIDETVPKDKRDYNENVTWWAVYAANRFLNNNSQK